MSLKLDVTFLGTGTSHGVPMIGCSCLVCRSDDPRDHRNRTSVSVTVHAGEAEPILLIDTPPEFRLGALATGLSRVDAVLVTHSHADHILGMDDLRRYNNVRGGPIDVYADAETLAAVRRVFGYAEAPYDNPDRPSLNFHELAGPAAVAGVPVTPVPLMHGRRRILGFRIGDFAYCSDCSAIPPASQELLTQLDLLVLGCLRYTPHPAHFNVEAALAAIEQLRPRRALLTHIAHEIGHADLAAKLPPHIQPAYDGQRVSVA
jgi:phosphoribosyl 1,2-cyclic phosphate phosphodiesterase